MNQCGQCKSKTVKKWYSGSKCEKCYRRGWYLKNKNKEHQKSRKRKYYLDNKEEILEKSKEYKKQYYKNNKEKIIKANKKWYLKNKENLPDRTKENKARYRERYKNDLDFKIKVNLRNRLNNAIKNNQKAGSAVKDLGCSITEFKEHMESQFQEGMSWDNWGRKTWHIDHITAISSFDLTDKDELKKACHYTNLQPLWAKDNISKSNKLLD